MKSAEILPNQIPDWRISKMNSIANRDDMVRVTPMKFYEGKTFYQEITSLQTRWQSEFVVPRIRVRSYLTARSTSRLCLADGN